MKQQLLCLKTLPSYAAGDLTKRFDELLAKQVKDCIDRPGIEKARTLTLKITLRPKKKQDGSADDVYVDVDLATKGPGYPLQCYLMTATNNGGLRFQPDNPMSPDQSTLDFGDDES
jgi:hypothetical protein